MEVVPVLCMTLPAPLSPVTSTKYSLMIPLWRWERGGSQVAMAWSDLTSSTVTLWGLSLGAAYKIHHDYYCSAYVLQVHTIWPNYEEKTGCHYKLCM